MNEDETFQEIGKHGLWPMSERGLVVGRRANLTIAFGTVTSVGFHQRT